MIVTCRHCETRFDDARISTVCPHPLIASEDIIDRKALAATLLGKDLRFSHYRGGPVYRVQSITWTGFVILHDMGGKFLPSEFVIVSKEQV